jgi:hypothetical protein
MLNDETVREFLKWLTTTPVADVMNDTSWAWPIAESLHFIGLSLLVGTVGLFDLRLLGVGKGIPFAAMHRLIPFGIAGFCVNVLTGASFFSAAPFLFAYNPSFHIKVVFIALAGLNVLLFYTASFRRLVQLGPQDSAPFAAKLAGGLSLACWVGVITCGRLLTFYKPPFHWCPWC